MASAKIAAVLLLAFLAFATVAKGEALIKLTDADFDTKVRLFCGLWLWIFLCATCGRSMDWIASLRGEKLIEDGLWHRIKALLRFLLGWQFLLSFPSKVVTLT